MLLAAAAIVAIACFTVIEYWRRLPRVRQRLALGASWRSGFTATELWFTVGGGMRRLRLAAITHVAVSGGFVFISIGTRKTPLQLPVELFPTDRAHQFPH